MQQVQVITTKQLRDNLAEVLEKVAIGGQSFQIVKFGKVKAKMVPTGTVDKGWGAQVSDQPLAAYWGQEDMQQRVSKQKKLHKTKRVDWKKLPGFGMWRDRKDMEDPAKWVHEMRIKQSYRLRDK